MQRTRSANPLPLLWGGLDIAAYYRLSQDRAGKGLAIVRQDRDSMALVVGRQGDPATVAKYDQDNDRSATKGERPDFLRLISDIKADAIQIIIAWSVDRLTRNPDEASEIIRLAKTTRLRLVVTVREGEFNLLMPDGIKRFRDAAAIAEHEIGVKVGRQTTERQQQAESGALNGGGRRPFGYQREVILIPEPPYRRVILVLDPWEAGVIREAARRILAGEALAAVVRDFASRGIRKSDHYRIYRRTLRKTLMSARISGRREYYGKIVATGAWPKIIEPEESDRLRVILSRPPKTATVGRKHLLSGTLRCGICGYHLNGIASKNLYRCVVLKEGGGGCGRVSIRMSRTDELVGNMVIHALSSAAFWDRLMAGPDTGPMYAELREIEDDLEALAGDLGRREITRAEWRVARGELIARQTTLRTSLATSETRAVLLDLQAMPGTLSQRYNHLTNDQKRVLVSACIDKITVKRAVECETFEGRIVDTIEWAA